MSDLDDILRTTAEQIGQRLDMEDRLEVPREVEHFCYFRRKSTAQAAALELGNHAYYVKISRSGLKHALVATKVSGVALTTAEAFVTEVHAIVVRHGGDYDGWGAPVER